MIIPIRYGASHVAQRVKNLLAMQETRVWSLGGEYQLEKEMATHSSIVAWKIPWTEEEPGGLQSMGSQRVRHNWVHTHTHTHTHTISITLLTLQLIIKYLNHEKELIVILTYTVNLYVNRYSVLKTFRLYMNNRVLSSILFDLLTMLWKTIIKW